jgi:EpsI family protein
MSESIRFFSVAAMLLVAVTFLSIRERDEVVPARQRFATFPHKLGTWVGTDLIFSPDVLETLGPGDFLNREYRDATGENTGVDLFLAYFPTQRTGDTLHSPRHCLPGSGWIPLESSEIAISPRGEAPFRVNRYLIERGPQRALALYWYWAHGRAESNEYWAKYYLVRDSIRLNRSDGSMIRVTTELQPHESVADAQSRLLALLNPVFGALDTYVPR